MRFFGKISLPCVALALFSPALLVGQTTGIDVSLSSIPSNATEVVVVVDGNGTSVRNSTTTNGATSLVLRTGIAAGSGYRVRAVAISGSGTFPAVLVGGKSASVNVVANSLTTTSITLSSPSLNLSSSNPTSVSSGATFVIAGSITDSANFLDGSTTLRMWTNTGTAPTTNTVGTQNYIFNLSKSGDIYSFSFSLTAPPTSTVLYYQIGENGSAFNRSDGTQAPFLVLPNLNAGTSPLSVNVVSSVTAIDVSVSGIPSTASEIISVIDGNGISLRNSTATNGATSLVLRSGLPAGNGYRVRVVAIRGSGTFPSVVAGGKAAGVNVAANAIVMANVSLTAPTLTLAGSNPTAVSPGATFVIAGSITDSANFLDGSTTLRMWTNTGTAPTTNTVGTQNYIFNLSKSGDIYSFSFSLTAPPTSTVLYYQIGENRSPFDRSDGTQASFLVLPDLSLNDIARSIVIGAGLPPTITNQPSNQSVTVGGSASFSVTASGTAPFSYQWRKDGTAIAGATSAILTLSNVQISAAGSYTVVVTNSASAITSNAAQLTVNPAVVAPAITAQTNSQTVLAGANASFSVDATGTAPLSYQWRKDGVAIFGATAATLILSSVQSIDAGSYTVVITNSAGSTTSNAATLAVTIPNPGRLINLSILAIFAAGDTMTIGTVLGGAGTSGTKPLLVRAAGPSLTQFGVITALPDPKLDLFSGQTVVSTNDNWGGTVALNTAFAQVGAFAYAAAASKDAAVFNPAMPVGSYTVQVSGVGGATGTVIAELYDATPSSAFTLTTPRLINVSVLKQINTGEILTAGFVIGGSTSKQVLIRAIGPTLGPAPFNVPGVMADPKLDLFSGQTVINSNDNWGGGTALATAFVNVGAFALGATSRDAALLVTLQPGNYTAQVTGANGSAGVALVEIYEVP